MKLGKIATSFSRGLNQAATHTIGELECQVSENFVFKDRSARVRLGTKLHAEISGAAPIVALEKFYNNDGDSYFCAVAGGQLHYSTTSGEFVSISSEAISGDVQKAVFDGAMYFTDYSSPIKYFNGGTVGIAGLSSPQYRLQLSDMEDVTKWTANTVGAATQDTNYMHREEGDKSITFTASSPSTAAVFQYGGIDNSLNSVIHTDSNNDALYLSRRSLARDSTSTIYMLSVDGVLRQSLNNGSTWSTSSITTGLTGFTLGGKYFPIISDTSNNLVAIGRSAAAKLKVIKKTATTWATLYDSAVDGASDIYSADVGVDTSNNINILAMSITSTSTAKFDWVRYYYNGTTETSTLVNSSSVPIIGFNFNRSIAPVIAVDRSNINHYLMQIPYANSEINYITSKSSTIMTNVASGNISGTTLLVGADMVVDTSSTAHILYTFKNETVEGFPPSTVRRYNATYKRLFEGSSYWGSSLILVNNDYRQAPPVMSMEKNNKVHMLWKGTTVDSPTQYQMRYTTSLSSIHGPTDLFQAGALDDSVSLIDNYLETNNIKYARTSSGYAIVYSDGNDVRFRADATIKWAHDPVNPLAFNLNYFASNVSSDQIDLIKLFIVPNKKSQISSCVIRFVDSNPYYASKELVQTSAWTSISSDEWGMNIAVAKSSFTLTNAAFNWGSCNMEMTLTPVSSSGTTYVAKVAVDNIRMLKSPPVIGYSVSTYAKSNLLFWGSSSQRKRQPPSAPVLGPGIGGALRFARDQARVNSYINTYSERDALQLEGLKQIADPIPSGTWYYKSTFVKESPSGYEIESNPSQQSSGWIVSNNVSSWTYLGITNVPIAPAGFGVSGRRIYRRKSNEEFMRHVYTIHDNSTTTFFDTVPNTILGWELEEDHDPPPNAKYMLLGSDQRMYYFNVAEFGNIYPSRVRVSKPYEPYYAPTALSLDISPDDGTEGTGMFEFGGVMHLLKERSTWSFAGGIKNVSESVGCVAPKSIAIGRNEVFWLSDEGPIKFNGRFYNISHSLDGRSLYRIQTILDRLPKAYIKNAVGKYFDGYYLLAVTDQGSTRNNLVLCYDVDNDVWTTFPNTEVSAWATWNGYKDGYRLFYGNYSGQICEFLTGDYDISTPISWSIRSKEFGVPSPEEYYRKSYWFVENLDGNGKTMTIQPYYDFTQTSSLAEGVLVSGTQVLVKNVLTANDAASFFSIGASGSGRIKINVAELYAKQESQR